MSGLYVQQKMKTKIQSLLLLAVSLTSPTSGFEETEVAQAKSIMQVSSKDTWVAKVLGENIQKVIEYSEYASTDLPNFLETIKATAKEGDSRIRGYQEAYDTLLMLEVSRRSLTAYLDKKEAIDYVGDNLLYAHLMHYSSINHAMLKKLQIVIEMNPKVFKEADLLKQARGHLGRSDSISEVFDQITIIQSRYLINTSEAEPVE